MLSRSFMFPSRASVPQQIWTQDEPEDEEELQRNLNRRWSSYQCLFWTVCGVQELHQGRTEETVACYDPFFQWRSSRFMCFIESYRSAGDIPQSHDLIYWGSRRESCCWCWLCLHDVIVSVIRVRVTLTYSHDLTYSRCYWPLISSTDVTRKTRFYGCIGLFGDVSKMS